jgi:hypothetical protein
MITNQMAITINRPLAEVFAYVSDLQNSPQWQKGLLEVRRISEVPLGTGAQYMDVRKFKGGRNVESVIQCTTYEPDKKIVLKTISSSWPYEDTYLFESVAGGTRLTNRLALQTSGLMAMAGPLISAGLRLDMKANFATLKDMLENQGTAIPNL